MFVHTGKEPNVINKEKSLQTEYVLFKGRSPTVYHTKYKSGQSRIPYPDLVNWFENKIAGQTLRYKSAQQIENLVAIQFHNKATRQASDYVFKHDILGQQVPEIKTALVKPAIIVQNPKPATIREFTRRIVKTRTEKFYLVYYNAKTGDLLDMKRIG